MSYYTSKPVKFGECLVFSGILATGTSLPALHFLCHIIPVSRSNSASVRSSLDLSQQVLLCIIHFYVILYRQAGQIRPVLGLLWPCRYRYYTFYAILHRQAIQIPPVLVFSGFVTTGTSLHALLVVCHIIPADRSNSASVGSSPDLSLRVLLCMYYMFMSYYTGQPVKFGQCLVFSGLVATGASLSALHVSCLIIPVSRPRSASVGSSPNLLLQVLLCLHCMFYVII